MITASLKPKHLDEQLDPAKIAFTNEFHLLDNLTLKLVGLDQHGQFNLEFASEIKQPTPSTYQIKIKTAHFSNGADISIIDVMETIKRNIRLGGSHISLGDIVKTINLKDDETIEITLLKPHKSFLYYLSLPDLGILHKSQYEKDSLTAADFSKNTSGPFEYSSDSKTFTLKKNPHFRSEISYPEVVDLIDPTKFNIAKKLQAGDLDVGVLGIEDYLKNASNLSKDTNLNFLGTKTDSFTYLYFNRHSKRKTPSAEIRWLTTEVLNNFFIPETFSSVARKSLQYFPPESPAFNPSLEDKKKITSSEIPLSLKDKDIIIHTFSTAKKFVIWELVTQLEKINPKIKILADVDPKDFESRMKNGDIEIFMSLMSTDYRVPVEAINFEFLSKDSKLQDKNGTIKGLFDRYQTNNDSAEEKLILQDISREIMDQMYIIPMFHYATPTFYNSNRIKFGNLNHISAFSFWKIHKK